MSLLKCLKKGDFRLIGRFERGFILVECGGKVYIVDQHAIHERIRLEALCKVSKLECFLQEDELNKHNDSASYESKQSAACKGAIKITTITDEGLLIKMLTSLQYCKFPFICAHGRPSIIQLNIQ